MEQVPGDKLSVEFYPSVDDYVHISLKVSGSTRPSTVSLYAYQAFLFINAIVFPAFLLFAGYVTAAFVVFVLNAAAVLLLVPRVNADSFKEYYEQIIGDREKSVARVALSPEGVRYTADGGESFMPWHRITDIEETAEAIYFFFAGNGFGVRKSGFAYKEDEKLFLDSARRLLGDTKRLELGE